MGDYGQAGFGPLRELSDFSVAELLDSVVALGQAWECHQCEQVFPAVLVD
jgi:hypothetical protein